VDRDALAGHGVRSHRSGTCTVTGSLAIQQNSITEGQRQLDLPGLVRLRHGVSLLESAAGTVPDAQAV